MVPLTDITPCEAVFFYSSRVNSEKRLASRKFRMTSAKAVLTVVSILLISPVVQSISPIFEEYTESPNPSVSDQDEESWHRLSNPIVEAYGISEISGYIQSPYGPFDPINDPIPLGPWIKLGIPSPYQEYVYVVQSENADLQSLESSLQSIGTEVVDYLPDYSLLVSIPEFTDEGYIEQISRLPQVRWISPLPNTWKISPSLIPIVGISDAEVDLDITPLPNLLQDEIESLSNDIGQRFSNDYKTHHCDLHLCQVRGSDPSIIVGLALDKRVLKIDIGPVLSIHNSNASQISGIAQALDISMGNLTGLGEVLAISDTGLDSDHGDFDGRLRSPIYNLFGPDSSGADTNSGHGTHVAATLLGDGTGDSNATGMVPESTFHFYQLEVDSSGILARWGSLYEMFQHSMQNDATIQTNSWGSDSLVGQYTSDSRSADLFAFENPEFLVLFSAGDLSGSGVSPPSTAKNVLSVGSSSTGAFGSVEVGEVANSSSTGPTLDGRIKPDLVAPGVMICSARASEASFASGGQCSTSYHQDGTTPSYMTLSGSSMATPVVAGASAMARQYLREEIGIPSPRSDFIKALLVNGADDLGIPDIPNNREGWGQLNLSNSLFPTTGEANLSVFYDFERQIIPGHSFIYTFDISGDFGFDATLAWNDREGSVSADQNASRLVSDLDLIITAPDGSIYLGNHFTDGLSSTGGSSDQVNNIERVRLDVAQSGVWTVQIGHSGGFAQDFSIVLSAKGEELLESDLTVVSNSIFSSEINPLQGDTISIQLSWINQAAAPTGPYSITLSDITVGNEVGAFSMPSLNGGAIESFSLYHSFSTTGQHVLRLTLDYLSEVDELNDEISGSNNNVYELAFEVSQIGVRITPLMDDGTAPSTFEELEIAKSRSLEPSTSSLVTFQLELLNEGTSEITVDLSVTAVQEVSESGILEQPLDEWSKELNETAPWVLAPFGEAGDRITISLTVTDEDADISDSSEARYALPGRFVTDLTLFDSMAPTISHSVRLSVEVARVEGLFTIPAGTEDLGAGPGKFATFTLSVKNIGNGPTQYTVSCETEDRWIIHIGNSQSSTITLDPLSRLQFVPVPIRVKIPPNSEGLPAGASNQVSCTTNSVNDPTLTTTEYAQVFVHESRDFITEIFNSRGIALGPLAASVSQAVLNGELISTNLSITNAGNVPLEFEIRALSSSNTWPIQAFMSSEEPPLGEVNTLQVVVQPGMVETVTILTIVPLSAQKGDRNTITIKTTLDDFTVNNGTLLEVREVTTLDVESNSGFSIAMGQTASSHINLHNSGNVPLVIDLTLGTLPEGWFGGFLSGKQFSMDMNRDSVVLVGLELPGGIEHGLQPESVPVIIESTSPSGNVEVNTVNLGVMVVESVWLQVQSETSQIQGIDSETDISITVTNRGNVPSGVVISSESPDGWDVMISPNTISELAVGETAQITATISPRGSADDGLKKLTFVANSTIGNDQVPITEASWEVEISKARKSNSGGLSGAIEKLGLPGWTIAIVFILSLSGIAALGIKARREFSPLSTEEQLIPRGSALQSGSATERRAAALETSTSGEVVTGEVSDTEIQSALEETLPSLPTQDLPDGTPPLPLSGLPEGWTMEQWVAYGHIWWEQNGP